MTDILAISLQGMHQDMVQLDRISLNLANATTPAYKRGVAVSRAFGPGSFASTIDAQKASASATETSASQASSSPVMDLQRTALVQTDQRPGTLRPTGQKLDVALVNPGYFEISTEAGPAYTRQGNWQLDARGRLVTSAGLPVMGTGGEIVLAHPDPYIDATGQVFESTSPIGPGRMPVARLKVVEFEDAQQLVAVGDGLLRSEQSPLTVADTDIDVRQGFLENSNVNSMQEMTQMIRTMRHFEAMQKVALGYDDMIGSAIRKLGELS